MPLFEVNIDVTTLAVEASTTSKTISTSLIDEKTYEIKTENNNKYVEIETTSFSEFELTFLNVNNNANTETEITNPQTLDNIPTIIMVLLSSLTIFTLAFKTFKKRNNL